MVDRGRARVLGQHRKAAGAQVKLCDRAVAALTGAQRGIRVQKTTKVVNLCAEYEPFMSNSTKVIFALEAYVARLMFSLRRLAE